MVDLNRAWEVMKKNQLDALLASSPQNVFYSSGFLYLATADNSIFFLLRNIGPAFTLMPVGKEPVLIAPNSGRATAERFCTVKDRQFYKVAASVEMGSSSQSRKATFSILQLVKENFRSLGLIGGRIGIEGLDLPLNFYRGLHESFPKIEWVDAQEIFFELRAIKQIDEVERVRQATQLATSGLETAITAIKEGATEREIIAIYKEEVVRRGGSWCNTKFCAGRENGATISHQPSDYALRPNDPFIFDIGAVVQGYTTDLARMGYLGKPDKEGIKLYEVLRGAQEKAIQAMKPGVPVSEVFNIAQSYVQESGYPDYTRNNIGHGVGIDFEEEPFISPDSTWKIQEGMTLAVEIPFYDTKLGGFNVEDVVYITERGVEVLSSSLSKKLNIRS